MKKKSGGEEFKKYLLQGSGRAVALANRAAYRDEIVWGCSHMIAYDVQSNGTHSDFMYLVIRQADLQETCLAEILSTIDGSVGDTDLFRYQAELLALFLRDGYSAAGKKLFSMYEDFFKKLVERREPPEEYDYLRDDFEELCILLSVTEEYFLVCAEAVGTLLLKSDLFEREDFITFLSCTAEKFDGALEKCFRKGKEGLLSRELEKFVSEYREEKKTSVNQGGFFAGGKNSAKAREGENGLFDEERVRKIKALPVTFDDETDWHGVQSDCLRRANVPDELLLHIYESSFCSHCRAKAFRLMGERGILTDSLLAEGLLDADEAIRKEAEKISSRR